MKTNVLSLILFLAVQSIVSAQTIDLIEEQVNENDTVSISFTRLHRGITMAKFTRQHVLD